MTNLNYKLSLVRPPARVLASTPGLTARETHTAAQPDGATHQPDFETAAVRHQACPELAQATWGHISSTPPYFCEGYNHFLLLTHATIDSRETLIS